jgi:hypothetical protein
MMRILGVEVDRAGDGHRLPLSAGERADRGLEVREPRVEPPDDLLGRRRHGRVVERAEARAQLAPEEDVAGGVDVLGQRELLVDRLDAVLLRVTGLVMVTGSPLIRISPESAGGHRERVHQGRLPAPLPPTSATTSPG